MPITRIIVFRIRRTGGTFGTILTGNLPDSLNHYGYVVGIYLRLFRRYVFHGEQRSYTCVAPAGFPGATFPFARASMKFADGRRLLRHTRNPPSRSHTFSRAIPVTIRARFPGR